MKKIRRLEEFRLTCSEMKHEETENTKKKEYKIRMVQSEDV